MLDIVEDSRRAQALIDRLEDSYTVSCLVPPIYSRYVRVFHPGFYVSQAKSRDVTWREIAANTERTAHRLMQWHNIALLPRISEGASSAIVRAGGSVIEEPSAGNCPSSVSQRIYPFLESSTRNANVCWFGVWSGYGYRLRPNPTQIIKGPRREWDVYRGSLDWFYSRFSIDFDITNIVWPDDESWFLASDIELNSTYIGCDEYLCEALLGAEMLETFEVEAEDDITMNSDTVNPLSFKDPPHDSEIQVIRRESYSFGRSDTDRRDWLSNVKSWFFK